MPISTWGKKPTTTKKPLPLSNLILRYIQEHFLLITVEVLREAQLGSGVHRNNLWAIMALAVVGSHAAAACLREIHITTPHTTNVYQPHNS